MQQNFYTKFTFSKKKKKKGRRKNEIRRFPFETIYDINKKEIKSNSVILSSKDHHYKECDICLYNI